MSVAGVFSFFFMIFDSLRQARAALRTTYGINRFNVRVVFYLFERSRVQRHFNRNNYLFRFITSSLSKVSLLKHLRVESYETTLITYSFR